MFNYLIFQVLVYLLPIQKAINYLAYRFCVTNKSYTNMFQEFQKHIVGFSSILHFNKFNAFFDTVTEFLPGYFPCLNLECCFVYLMNLVN